MDITAALGPAPSRDDPRWERFEQDLFRRSRAGDPEARARLVERYRPLAVSIARRYDGPIETLDDLVQVACLGLLKAVDGFEPGRGLRFTSYAVPTIAGEIKRHYRDRTWTVHVARGLNELAQRVDRAISEETARTGRTPNVAVLAENLGVSEEDVVEAIGAGASRRPASLDTPLTDDGDSTIGDTLRSEAASHERDRAEARVLLDGLLCQLPPRDREVLRLRFEEDLMQSEIGMIVGISQMQVSRIIRFSLEKLRRLAEER